MLYDALLSTHLSSIISHICFSSTNTQANNVDRRYHNRLYRCYRQALAQVLTPTNKRTESRVPRQTLTARYRIGEELGLDPAVILQTSHGRRSIDVLKVIAPEKANWECKQLSTLSFFLPLFLRTLFF